MKTLLTDRIAAPRGAPFEAILIAVDGEHLCALDFTGFEERMNRLLARNVGAHEQRASRDPQGYASRIRAYLQGDVQVIDSIPVNTGGTAFQQSVWQALRTIPAGETASYAEQARRIGKPTATRAVGAANGRNPIAIVLPCHRVRGANGALTGYAGGLATKAWLLEHETRHTSRT
jgi:methylated-DNA-[protein]-cysteine S-methyltransferase